MLLRDDGFLRAAALRGDFLAATFFLLAGRFLRATFLRDAFFLVFLVLLVDVFFLRAFAGERFLLLVRRADFLLLVFLVDFFRVDGDFPALFAADFFLDVFFTEVLLPLARFLAAAFLLGIDIASKVDSENGRLYIRTGRAEAF